MLRSFPFIRLFGISFRLHWIFLLWIVIDLATALITEASVGRSANNLSCLLVAAILHELGHGIVARRFGGSADRTHLWPLGGLTAFPAPPEPRTLALIALAGPAVNCAFAVALFPYIVLTDQGNSVLLHLGPLDRDPDLFASFFGANQDLLLLNLLPALPLDGGRIFRALLSRRVGELEALGKVVLASRFSAVALAALALFAPLGGAGRSALLGIGVVVWFSAEGARRRALDHEAGESWFGRWLREKKELRAAQRSESAARERVAEDAILDTLLEKVHREGEESLSRPERQFLERVGRRFKK